MISRQIATDNLAADKVQSQMQLAPAFALRLMFLGALLAFTKDLQARTIYHKPKA